MQSLKRAQEDYRQVIAVAHRLIISEGEKTQAYLGVELAQMIMRLDEALKANPITRGLVTM